MRVRLEGHLSDPDTLALIAPGLSVHAEEADAETLARIDHHEFAHGRRRVPGDVAAWEGPMPALALVREAAGEVMRHLGGDLPAGGIMSILRRAHARLDACGDGPARGSVEVISRERVHDGFYALDDLRLRHETFAGGMSEALRRYVFVSFDAAIMLPYDPVSDRVLLVEQFRLGPFGRGSSNPWMLEPVAGLIDPGQGPEETARREAREEAGLDIRELIAIGSGYSSPGASTGFHHHYIGLCDIPEAARTGGAEDEGEDIRTVPMLASELFSMLDAGRLRAAPLILCALALRGMRERLRA